MSNQTDASADTLEQLFVELRRIKQASGFSYGQLADRTHYSRSSWERFLNGKQPPSKVAVEQFAAATGVDPRPLLALLERAGQPSAREPATGEAHASPPAAPPAAAETSRAQRAPTAQALDAATSKVREPARPAAEPPRIMRRAPESTPRLLARRGIVARPSWQRGLRAAGLISAGAVMGAVAAVLAMGSGSGPHGGSADTPGAQASGTAVDRGASVVPAAGKVDAHCSGDTCLRRDPQAMDCQWDAATAHDTWLRGMHIELRYSPACHAVWGRIENGAVGDVVTIKDRTGLELQATIRTDRDTYTQMLAVTDDAPAETVTICGAIPSQKQSECSPSSHVQP
ncbi:helix-turn-helix domain-containing protein [Streptomyces sp. HUAS TT7]|uniref:helix-turn-helix domain-containing protein n=1 Tax=Streptomyces sp. HUAS TT7 TaxID=3447507 RepID=UPI003F65B48C